MGVKTNVETNLIAKLICIVLCPIQSFEITSWPLKNSCIVFIEKRQAQINYCFVFFAFHIMIWWGVNYNYLREEGRGSKS